MQKSRRVENPIPGKNTNNERNKIISTIISANRSVGKPVEKNASKRQPCFVLFKIDISTKTFLTFSVFWSTDTVKGFYWCSWPNTVLKERTGSKACFFLLFLISTVFTIAWLPLLCVCSREKHCSGALVVCCRPEHDLWPVICDNQLWVSLSHLPIKRHLSQTW